MEQTEKKPKWSGLGYEPVPGLVNRHISRYLRTQRKNMRAFFAERGFFEYLERLEAIRKNPRLGMITKNRQFKRILDDYAAQVTAQRTPVAAPEAALVAEAGGVALRPEEPTDGGVNGAGPDAAPGVLEVAQPDGAEPVA